MHPSELAEVEYLRRLAEQLKDAAHGHGGVLIDAAAVRLGCSRQRVYDKLRTVGWRSGRKLRSDKGDSRISAEELKKFATIMSAPTRANGKRLLDTIEAREIALANGKLTHPVSPRTLQRLMRKHGLSPSQQDRASSHTTMRSEHPNELWQLDPSVCVLYYLRDGRMAVMEAKEFYKNKPANFAKIANERVLRYVVTDHTSGAFFARYYNAAGEDQETLFEFLMEAFAQRDGFVMHGVPFNLVWDAGSANTAHAIQALLDALAVRHWPHLPGNPRAKGQVEQANNLVECKFESRLIFERIDSVEHLNRELDAWQIDFNAVRKHSRHGHSRWGQWQTIRAEQLRMAPSTEVCRSLMNQKPERRTVKGNLTISFTVRGYERSFYSVEHVPTVRVGEQVDVVVNAYRLPAIFVVAPDEHGVSRHYSCDPIAYDRNGFPLAAPHFSQEYKATRDTDVDIARKDMREAVWGERDERDAMKARKKGRVALDGEINPFADVHARKDQIPNFIARRGTEMDVPLTVQIELKPLDHVAALKALAQILGRRIEPAENALVAQLYPDGVPEDQINALAERLATPIAVPATRHLRAV